MKLEGNKKPGSGGPYRPLEELRTFTLVEL